jgi:hypothetical protein
MGDSRKIRHKSLTINKLPRMDSNHDKVIQSHLCYRYTTRQKEGSLRYHIVEKSQMTMTERMLRHDK